MSMNDNHIQQIFANYIERFSDINGKEHQEYYKWQIAKLFHDQMDDALKSPAEELPQRLYQLKKLTSNLIDSFTQPFHGLSKFAENEPETVREMFNMLFRNATGDLLKRQEDMQEFIKRSHELRDKYYPNSYLYNDDMHSVSSYLFLYAPDYNYIYKSTHALAFADCIEFYDDWGYGTDLKLPVYYRMCDELVAAIKSNKELLHTDASRFENGWGVDPNTLHPDKEKHILAFDLIYCCSTYGLFKGISFTRPKTKERQLIQELKDKAKRYKKEFEDAQSDYEEKENALSYINNTYIIGAEIHHNKFGKGIIKEKNDSQITVDFADVGEKKLGILTLIIHDLVSVNIPNYQEKITYYRPYIKNRERIKSTFDLAKKNFSAYSQYINEDYRR